MKTATFLVAAGLTAALGPAAGAAPLAPPAATVHIKDFAFVPARLTVAAGTVVTFVNDDEEPHTATADDRSFDSEAIDTHGTWSHAFRSAGTYAYTCELHPMMHGTIVVRAGGEVMRRERFLEHLAWTGAGIGYALQAGGTFAPAAASEPLAFVQISDSHVGFKLPANPDVLGTLNATVDRINALDPQPGFVFHTGDVSHLSRAEEFDAAKGALSRLRVPLFTIPGEHDAIGAEGVKRYTAAFPNRDAPDGWWSFDRGGVHFVALVNVLNFETMGVLGERRLAWLADDLARQRTDTPIVVFGHVPLYALYPQWGWTTQDGAQAIALLRRFSAVTVLNGHIHQIVRKTDGTIRFTTAAATAYPQPAPGSAPAPGPLTLPAPELLRAIGYRSVRIEGSTISVSDTPLSG